MIFINTFLDLAHLVRQLRDNTGRHYITATSSQGPVCVAVALIGFINIWVINQLEKQLHFSGMLRWHVERI